MIATFRSHVRRLRTRRTYRWRQGRVSAIYRFNPRLTSPHTLFQSAPHFGSEANDQIAGDGVDQLRFNPRLTSAARRTLDHAPSSNSVAVSIRASLRQRGELGTVNHRVSSSKFQSAPHFGSEANGKRGR